MISVNLPLRSRRIQMGGTQIADEPQPIEFVPWQLHILSEILIVYSSKDHIGIDAFLFLLGTEHYGIAHKVIDEPRVSMGVSSDGI